MDGIYIDEILMIKKSTSIMGYCGACPTVTDKVMTPSTSTTSLENFIIGESNIPNLFEEILILQNAKFLLSFHYLLKYSIHHNS